MANKNYFVGEQLSDGISPKRRKKTFFNTGFIKNLNDMRIEDHRYFFKDTAFGFLNVVKNKEKPKPKWSFGLEGKGKAVSIIFDNQTFKEEIFEKSK